MNYDVIVIGAGFAGSVLARQFAEDNKKVLLIDKRDHIGGNMYEEKLDNGVRIHKYGPHIFHTNLENVFEYLKKFSGWYFYEHRVIGFIDGKYVPIPFNFKSLELLFDKEEADKIKEKLLNAFPQQKKVSIFELINHDEDDIKDFGKYVYNKVFENYTAKQWNITVDKIDTSVINRVPVILGYDDRYFQDKYQFMPIDGYTKVFENLLNNSNIDIRLNTEANAIIKLNLENKKIYFNNKEYNGIVIFSGAIDQLLNYKFGPLPYRSLDMVFENYKQNYYQPAAVVNYPNDNDYTRITEFKYLSNQIVANETTILKEYSKQYDYLDKNSTPYYPINNEDNVKLYNKYCDEIKGINNLYLCGRLGEYKYYNMDIVIDNALKLYEKIKKESY